MLGRIWWKEGRALAPIAVTLAVALGALQWFLLTYGGGDVPRGALVPIALGWAVLYALVAGAASFAGERELRMMGFLDALPVARGVLWLGKVTFVLGSSFLLGVIFRTVGAIGDGREAFTDAAFVDSLLTPTRIDRYFGLLLAEAAAWGIFWSAISKNALSAGILAVITTAVSASLGSIPIPGVMYEDGMGAALGMVPGRLAVVAILLIASWTILSWEQANWTFRGRGQAETSSAPPAESGGAWMLRSIHPDPALRSVAWQAAREGFGLWLLATGIILAIPIGELVYAGPSPNGSGVVMALIVGALLIGGASVFGLENAAGTRPFLDNLAVPPRAVWVGKVAAWVGGLAISVALLVIVSMFVGMGGDRVGALGEAVRVDRTLASFLMVGANGFAVGLLGGMVFSRRITAVLLSGIAASLVIAPQAALFGYELIPAWSLMLTPAILVAISFLWAGDWLAVRGDWRRWARLATLTTVPMAVLSLWYVAGRAWGIPDIGPQFSTTTRPGAGEVGLNGEYRQAAAPFAAPEQLDAARKGAPGLVDQSWDRATPEVVAAWAAGRAVIDSARRLAGLPGAIACDDQPVPSSGRPILPVREDRSLFASLNTLAALLTLDGIERRSRGDRLGAWEDIRAQYRMSDQAAAGASTLADYSSAMRLSEGALRQALAWARDPALTRDEIQAARQTLQQLVLPLMTEVIRAESGRLEAALSLPTDTWVDASTPTRIGRDGDGREGGLAPAFQRIANAWFVVPIWERERTRRILRRVTQMAVHKAGNDSFEPGGYEPFWPPGSVKIHHATGIGTGPEDYAATPMAYDVIGYLIGAERDYGRELTNRRALDTYLALRSWQVDHDGQAPATLDQLVPVMIESLPIDPFSPMREPLGYVRGGTVRDGQVLPAEPGPYYCLLSVGLNGRREAGPLVAMGQAADRIKPAGDDLLYVLPATIPPRASTP